MAPCIVAGLMAEGWTADAARQFLAEEAVRRRSRSRDGRGGNPSGSEGLNSYVNALPHALDRNSEGSHEVAKALHARTNSLRGHD